jgi:hypothetical protein
MAAGEGILMNTSETPHAGMLCFLKRRRLVEVEIGAKHELRSCQTANK